MDYFELDEEKKEKRNELVHNTLDYPEFLLKKLKILVHLGALIKNITPENYVALIKTPNATKVNKGELDDTVKTEDA